LKHKILGAIGLIAAGALLCLFAFPSYRQGEASIAGSKARDFALEWNGRTAHLSDLRGKVVVLNFWASWCPPCLDETPSLNRLQEQIASKGGVVLGVSEDEDNAAFAKFLVDQHVIFPTYRDPVAKKIAQEYGTEMYPETYFIARDGRIARKIVGAQDWQSPELVASLDALLDQK